MPLLAPKYMPISVPDDDLEILDIKVSELRREDGWLVLTERPDLPPSAS